MRSLPIELLVDVAQFALARPPDIATFARVCRGWAEVVRHEPSCAASVLFRWNKEQPVFGSSYRYVHRVFAFFCDVRLPPDRLPNLRSLSLFDCCHTPLSLVVQNFPRLEVLACNYQLEAAVDWSGATYLRQLAVGSNLFNWNNLTLPPNLEDLTLFVHSQDVLPHLGKVTHILQRLSFFCDVRTWDTKLPRVESLSFTRWMAPSAFRAVYRQAPSLKKLTIKSLDDRPERFLRGLEQLEVLKVMEGPFEDRTASWIQENLVRLRRLELPSDVHFRHNGWQWLRLIPDLERVEGPDCAELRELNAFLKSK